MLRNHQKSKQLFKHLALLTQQLRSIQQNGVLCGKSSNIRQGKIMSKLFGQRLTGSKKRWFPLTTDSTQATSPTVMFQQSQFGKTSNEGGKNVIRRTTVLNKLFMKHITDLMATGEISENILGKGLQVSRVKISQDFAYINVYWMSSCEAYKDAALENELQRCSGLLRHELSQLSLMGVVPRIKFVKDKVSSNMNQVEALLRNMDFGSDEEDQQDEIDVQTRHRTESLKQEFYSSKTSDVSTMNQNNVEENDESSKALEYNVPEMRHDVMGLDHKGIMIKLLTKMRKSKQAWEQHFQTKTLELDNSTAREDSSTIHSASFVQLARINEKLAEDAANSEKFEAFLAKRKEKRNTPERKKFRVEDHNIDDVNINNQDYPELLMSKSQRKIFEAEDYMLDELNDNSHK